jgi:hypothetical protein
MDRFIQKMLRPEVWDYWRETSMSNPRFDPGLKEPRAPWTDPVAKENIMYSGHLHAMAGMYGVLFDDAKYEQPKSIVFTRSTAWDKPEVYEYDLNSLNDVIYWQMAESGYLGIPCEPNIVFITCNQLPILGFRFHDIRKGTAVADEVTKNYAAAWAKKGVMTEGGKFITALMMRQGQIIPGDPAVTASEGLSMNAWNRELVRKLFPDAVYFGLRKLPDGTMVPFPKSVLSKVLAAKAKGEPVDQIEDRSFQWGMMPDYAFYTTFLSEIGDRKTLDAMVAHANRHMNPTWEKDGLYYPRNDRSYDENGNLVFMDPLSGNAGIAYAQLNVQDGMWMLYNKPWSKEHFADLALTQVPHTVDVLRASYVREKGALVLTLRGRGGQRAAADLTVGNVPAGKSWTLYRDGELMASSAGKSRDALSVTAVDGSLSIRGQIERETDFVLLLA